MFSWRHSRRAAVFLAAGVFVGGQICSAAAAVLPDPTRPPGRLDGAAVAAPADDNWQLGSILIAAQRRVAVINGRPLTVGEQISGARVVAIEPGRVRLRRGAREIVLELLSAHPRRRVVSGQD